MCIQRPGLLSVHLRIFCEHPNPLLNFDECFLPPLMSIILPSQGTLELFHESLFLVLFLPMRSEPLQHSIFGLIHPALLFLRTSDPSTLSPHPSPVMDSSPQSHFSQRNKVLSLHKSYCIFSRVRPTQLSELQALREPLGSLTGRASCLIPRLWRAVENCALAKWQITCHGPFGHSWVFRITSATSSSVLKNHIYLLAYSVITVFHSS